MRILIAEDEPISRRLLAAALKKMGHDVVGAENGRAAWETLQREDIRLVIADWEMPEMTGLELVRKLREEAADRYIYAILLTSRGLKQDIVLGLEAGADDYVTKPFDRDELMVRIKAGERVTRLEAELAERNEQLRRMALVDGLTGIANRRSFDEDFSRQREHAKRFSRAFSVVMIDIDHFKLYNDSLGHEAGDGALRAVAQLLAGALRVSDKVYRYGGEEFVCILPETDAQGAVVVAERLRGAIEGAKIPHAGNQPSGVVTISVGVASHGADAAAGDEELLSRADQALYVAKSGGRNRVAAWSAESPVRS